MVTVDVQINNGDPCPKREYRAWELESKSFPSLTDAIVFLIETNPDGFLICQDGVIVAEKTAFHYPITGGLDE